MGVDKVSGTVVTVWMRVSPTRERHTVTTPTVASQTLIHRRVIVVISSCVLCEAVVSLFAAYGMCLPRLVHCLSFTLVGTFTRAHLPGMHELYI